MVEFAIFVFEIIFVDFEVQAASEGTQVTDGERVQSECVGFKGSTSYRSGNTFGDVLHALNDGDCVRVDQPSFRMLKVQGIEELEDLRTNELIVSIEIRRCHLSGSG